MVTGRENIRKHDVVILLLFGVRRKHQAIKVAIGYPEVLGLSSIVRAHIGKAIRCARVARVSGKTKSSKAPFTISTESTSNIERKTNPVAHFDPIYGIANFNNLTEIFVSQHPAGLHICTSLIHVKVRSADICNSIG